MPKDKIIHFPRQKLETMSDSEFDAILKRLINPRRYCHPIPTHIQLIKSFRWPSESLRKRFLRREVKSSIMGFIEKEIVKMNRIIL